VNEIWRAFMASKRLSFDIRGYNLPFSVVRREAQIKNLKRSSDSSFKRSQKDLFNEIFCDLSPRVRRWGMVQKS